MTALVIRDLRIDASETGDDIVDEVQLEIAPGEILGLVGESGSGKTTIGLAALGHSRRGVAVVGGHISIGDVDIRMLGPSDLRDARGRIITYVPQDPSTALNPALRIETQLMEVLRAHDYGGSNDARQERKFEVMGEVLLPSDRDFLRRYPHQLSGGQQQRVGLAMAFACRPSVIVLDEPTTGLDVTTQAHVLDTVRALTRSHGVAALYVTHDLAVVATLADRVAVLYAGRVVEQGRTEDVFANPAHPYTRYLVAAAPEMKGERAIVGLEGRAPAPGHRPSGCTFAARCELADASCRVEFPAVTVIGGDREVRCVRPLAVPERTKPTPPPAAPAAPERDPVLSVTGLSVSYGETQVVYDVQLHVEPGECLALVGESGSGKTTVSRSIGGLHDEWVGEIRHRGTALARSARRRTTEQRLKIQYVFQNPYGSLNPRRTVGESVGRPLIVGGASRSEANRKVAEMLDLVSLTAAYASRYPDQISGGERQRVAIARALVSEPEILVCDEVTSALDVLVQAAIVELLADLRRELGLSMLFVTHNLPLVRSIAGRTAVMSDGRIVETGPTADLLANPQEEYTKRLIADTPEPRSGSDFGS